MVSCSWMGLSGMPGPVRERTGPGSGLLDDDAVDGSVDLLGQRLGDGRASCGRGRGLLTLGACDVLQESLDDRRNGRIEVLLAGDHVADEDDRVDASRFRGAVEG